MGIWEILRELFSAAGKACVFTELWDVLESFPDEGNVIIRFFLNTL